ncbi:MAG: ABC transporter permease [Eubacteriales bacterium]|jgi:lipoprotein-releasing system permease protein|nr:ABC transporter permease [Eubacteriales bacterium]MDD3611117.1 ABC transporter permease [Eubacteriales bacterium]
MRLPLSIALRFLKSSPGQTLLIALGIGIGVSVQIFIGSLIQGLQLDLVDTTIGSQSQITLSGTMDDPLIEEYDNIMADLKDNQSEALYVSAVADGPALFTKESENYSILLRGLMFNESEGIYKVQDNIIEGSLPEINGEVLIGADLQDDTGLKVGDSIEVLAGSGESYSLKISGVFDLKVSNLNRSWVLTTLATAQEVFAYEDKVTAIEMQVKDVFTADEIAAAISDDISAEIKVENWKDQNAALLSGLNGQSVSSLMIQVFVLVSVLLGIASVLAITVVQKSRQIGILKAMGIQDKAASRIFLLQGLMLGVAGAIVGVALGLGLAYAFTKFALNPDGTPVVSLFIDPKFITLSAVIAIVVSALAAMIPARKSSRLNPIEVIRNG